MPGIKENLKRGTIEMILLTLLKEKDMYGYQIAQELKKRSDNLFTMREGTLYPTLHRLLDKKYLSDREEAIGSRQLRVYYHLEPAGEERLKEILEEYHAIQSGIQKIFGTVKSGKK